jgi:putative ABC transport system ATP-binding protein
MNVSQERSNKMQELLRVENLSKNNILNDINFSMGYGEMVAVMGPSGSGKSTLLYNVSGMDEADAGSVWLKDTEIVSLSEKEKAKMRLTQMGFVFQQMNVLSNLTILDNILLPANHAKKGKKEKAENMQHAKELMQKFHIEMLAKRAVTEVSGGQLQRACICRSMMMKPEILFADEPTGALNQSAAEEVIRAFQKLNEEGTSILMVTHDGRIASRCERILYLVDGCMKGELVLGKWKQDVDQEREEQVVTWLRRMGW